MFTKRDKGGITMFKVGDRFEVVSVGPGDRIRVGDTGTVLEKE